MTPHAYAHHSPYTDIPIERFPFRYRHPDGCCHEIYGIRKGRMRNEVAYIPLRPGKFPFLRPRVFPHWFITAQLYRGRTISRILLPHRAGSIAQRVFPTAVHTNIHSSARRSWTPTQDVGTGLTYTWIYATRGSLLLLATSPLAPSRLTERRESRVVATWELQDVPEESLSEAREKRLTAALRNIP